MGKSTFYYFRYISWIAIICSLAGSALLFVIGAEKSYSAFAVFLFDQAPSPQLKHLDSADIAISYITKSLDTFLVALVLFIFAHGIFTLFIKNGSEDNTKSVLSWVKTPNMGHLKNKLTEVIIVILFVKFLELVLIEFDQLSWEILILPLAILLLCIGIKLLGLGQGGE